MRHLLNRYLVSSGFRPTMPTSISFDHLHNQTIGLKFLRYAFGSIYTGRLPAYFFHIQHLDSQKTIGYCDLRIGWHEELHYAGQIGYGVYRQNRGHGYAKQATCLLLGFAHELNMAEILITCNPDNIASYKTLMQLPGTYKGQIEVAKSSVVYQFGEKEKCQFLFKTENFALPHKTNPQNQTTAPL